jgi:hypothetical protein
MNPETSRYLAGEAAGPDRAPAAIFAVAVAASLAVHAGLGWAARDARVSLFEGATGATAAQRLRLREESALRTRLVPPPPVADAAAEPADRAAASTPAELLSSMDTDAPAGIFEPPALPAGVDASVGGLPPPPAVASETAPPVPWQPREQIVEIAQRFADEDLLAIPRREVASIERDRAMSDVVPEFRPAAAVEAAAAVPAFAWATPVPARTDLSAPKALLEVPPEAPPPVEAAPAPDGGASVAAYLAEVPSDVAPAKPIENVLDAAISVYRPKAGDDAVYFRVDVKRKGADVLPAVPRDILLVQDASRSIAPERLHQCREAFKRVLASALLPTDRFNVLSFNTDNAYAFPDGWRAPTAENVAAGTAFLDGIRPEGNTDIYNAMRGVLALPRDPGRSTLVFLLTDGVATAGDIRRDSRIIGEFSSLNAGGVSVFDIGVSKRSDEYLLSMLSFCNRGGPAEIANDRFEIPKVVGRVFDGVGSPVLTDIRFLFDTASGAVVTPRMTENLYLDRPLRLYGRAPAGTKEVTFQARGRNGGKKYDMVFTLRLGDPAPGSGDPSIASSWARTRIYDLVASYAGEEDPATLAEMSRIGAEHRIPIPFQGRLGR